jgi:hypothetical protein
VSTPEAALHCLEQSSVAEFLSSALTTLSVLWMAKLLNISK